MLNLTASRINRSEEQAVDATAVLSAVGCALVQGTAGSVKPSTGAAGEVFVGASLSQPLTLFNFPKVEALTVNGSNQITLSKTPLAGSLRVVNAAGAALVAGTPASNATDYSITGQVITVNVALAGQVVTVVYQFAPTVTEARMLQGDTQPGGAAALTTGTVGVIQAGTVYTTEYDTTVDWSVANPVVKVGANGKFTIGGTGAVVPNAQVRQVPSSGDVLLGLYFSA